MWLFLYNINSSENGVVLELRIKVVGQGCGGTASEHLYMFWPFVEI